MMDVEYQSVLRASATDGPPPVFGSQAYWYGFGLMCAVFFVVFFYLGNEIDSIHAERHTGEGRKRFSVVMVALMLNEIAAIYIALDFASKATTDSVSNQLVTCSQWALYVLQWAVVAFIIIAIIVVIVRVARQPAQSVAA